MGTSQRRITKELQECMDTPPAGMTISLPSEADYRKWDVVLKGPPGTPYAGGVYNITVTLPLEYPFKAPQVNFATRIYHPNVTNDSLGNICMGVLKAELWKPASRMRSVLEAVRQLLVEPNPEDPLETRIAEEYKNNRPEFDKNVKNYVARYAKGSSK
ncbi:ubiquitin-conjugating enzyme [Xylaria sp. FL1042]|nr:ubiquitin-conjugating enzyme [Xylaria sp. FL1042]